MFNNVPEYPPANFKGVVRPNFDTLYSISYLDMTKEPVVGRLELLFRCRLRFLRPAEMTHAGRPKLRDPPIVKA